MNFFTGALFLFLIVCAITVSISKNLLNSVLLFMAYSVIMSIIWIIIESPDLAITEAAVGAGVTTILFFQTLRRIEAMGPEDEAIQVPIEEDDVESLEMEAEYDEQ